jgi:hypothetical protein
MPGLSPYPSWLCKGRPHRGSPRFPYERLNSFERRNERILEAMLWLGLSPPVLNTTTFTPPSLIHQHTCAEKTAFSPFLLSPADIDHQIRNRPLDDNRSEDLKIMRTVLLALICLSHIFLKDLAMFLRQLKKRMGSEKVYQQHLHILHNGCDREFIGEILARKI